MKKIVKRISFVLLILVLLLLGTFYAVWHNELASGMSFRQIRSRDDAHRDGAVYELKMKGSYYMDDFIAQGGVSNDSELIDFVVSHITKGLIPISIKNPQIGCSSFTAQTANGDRLFARNYDMWKTNTCIVHTEASDSRHATVSTADLGFLGMDASSDVEGLRNTIVCLGAVYAPLDGMNDAGVSCGVYVTRQGGDDAIATNQNTDKPDFTTTTFLRMVLDYADNLEEAVEIAQAYDMHDSAGTSYHYMIADASGRSAIFEWVNGTDATDRDGSARQLVITYNDADAHIGEAEGSSDFQLVTNFIIQPNYYDNEEDMNGLDRYRRLAQQLTPVKGIVDDEGAAMDLLASVGRRGLGYSGEAITVHSVIYNMTTKMVYWVPNEHYNDPNAWFVFQL